MSVSWKFYPKQPTDTIRNSTAGEFFSNEAVGHVTEALVREGIQNTLDARRKRPDGSKERAQVRIYLSESTAALPAPRAKHWFGTLWPHVMASGNGLRNQPSLTEPCPFLVFEDFGTTGLNGNEEDHDQLEDVTNHFLRFFRGEGLSGSEDDKTIGSWGVGKTVFPRASRISSFLGLTVRSDDDRKLLLGRSILKYHRVNDRSYKSDGYFGHSREDDGFMLPTGDPNVLADFRTDFRIRRQAEPGLSIVVPWYELDDDDGISRQKVMAAVLRGFFYPILMGHLAVTVATPHSEATLDADSIIREVEAIDGTLAVEMLPLLKLTEWAQTLLDSEFQTLQPPAAEESQKWSPDLVPEAVVRHIRESLTRHQRVALRVPMHVQKRTEGPMGTFFRMFLEHSSDDREKPVFIRDELIIPNVQSPRVTQVRALVIVEDRPLAGLLRDAENPAHTEWSPDTSNFKNKYKFGPGVIHFVRKSVFELLRIVNQAEEEPDPSITIDFFSLPAEPEDADTVPARRRRPRPTEGEGPTQSQQDSPPRRLRRFRIEKMSGGFSIRAGDPGAELPRFIDVRVAYDIRRGNPLKKYHPADFDLGKAPIRRDTLCNGIQVTETNGNRMLIQVQEPEFQLDVTGFDTDRELYVKAVAQEVADD
jgi:hypothetical protein